jgi:hypothetical protein
MDDTVASLTSADNWWGNFLVVSTLVVLIGVVGEAIAEITGMLDRSPTLKRSVVLVSTLILIVGIGGELLGEGKTMSIGDQIAGLLNDKASAANEHAGMSEKAAANANLKAEKLKSENLAFEKILAPRRIFFAIPKDKFFLITDLDQFKGTPALLQVVSDFEAKVLANDIFTILQGHGWRVKYTDEAETGYPSNFSEGLSVHTHKASLKPSLANGGFNAGAAVTNWLTGTAVDPGTVPHFDDIQPWSGVKGFLTFDAPDNIVLISVGMKPVAAMLGHSSVTITVVNPNNPIK